MFSPLSEYLTNITQSTNLELNHFAHAITEEGCSTHSFGYSPAFYGWFCRNCDMAIPREAIEELLEERSTFE